MLLSSTCVTISILDSLCIYLVCIYKRAKKPSMIAILNLLFAHLLQGILVVPSYVVKRLDLKHEKISGTVCDVFRFSYMVTNYISCLSLLLISADRMFAIRKPLLYRTSMTSRGMINAILICWIYTVILCIIPFIPEPESHGKCRYNPQREWTLFMLTCNTMFPFIIILYCYCAIFKSARSSRILRSSICANNTVLRANHEPRESELRVAKISSIIASAYVLCWGPSFLYYLLLAACPSCFRTSYFDSEAERIVAFAMKYLTFLNGIIAPIIYCYRYNMLREMLPCFRSNQVAPVSD